MGINEIIAAYIAAKQQESNAKKQAESMKALLIEHAAGRELFTTDLYTVFVKTTTSSRLDTIALYRDFPDIKDVYRKETTSTTINAIETAAAAKKPA